MPFESPTDDPVRLFDHHLLKRWHELAQYLRAVQVHIMRVARVHRQKRWHLAKDTRQGIRAPTELSERLRKVLGNTGELADGRRQIVGPVTARADLASPGIVSHAPHDTAVRKVS